MFERENLHSFIYSHSNSGTLLVGAHDDETIQDEDPARTLLSLVIATIDDGDLLVRLCSSEQDHRSEEALSRFESKAWFELQSRSALLNHARRMALATAARPMRWEDRQSSMSVLLEPLVKLVRELEEQEE